MNQIQSRNFWEVHGIFFLFFMAFFPRLTMLFATSAPFGILAWLGWLFFPYLTAAIFATKYYWHTNPVLCTIAWFMAFFGTGGEYKAAHEAKNNFANPDYQRREQIFSLEQLNSLSTLNGIQTTS
jgi:hypothetical protein